MSTRIVPGRVGVRLAVATSARVRRKVGGSTWVRDTEGPCLFGYGRGRFELNWTTLAAESKHGILLTFRLMVRVVIMLMGRGRGIMRSHARLFIRH